jgi:hypothetical protein
MTAINGTITASGHTDANKLVNWKDKFDDAHFIARECLGMIEGEILFCTDEGTLGTLHGLRDKLEQIK